MTGFALDPRLAADSILVANGPLSQLRLMDEARFAWLLLVPRLPGLVELVDLEPARQLQLLVEAGHASRWLQSCVPCDKLNLGALGNIVPQLHLHVLARVRGDAAWPGPAWGSGPRVPMTDAGRERMLALLHERLDPGYWEDLRSSAG